MRVATVAVIGAGTMGRGIAQSFAQNGFAVIMYAYDEEEKQSALDWLRRTVEGLVSRQKLVQSDMDRILSNIRAVTDLGEVAIADLVVEAIVENAAIKREMFRKLDRICRQDTLLTSNTSSIPISDLAAVVTHPERVCGMHFFYPPPIMPVIEIPTARKTSCKTVGIVKGVVQKLRKHPIEVKESPGFVFNRLMIPMINEAAFLLQEGVASREDIDAMMRLAATHPIGPLQLADIIGLDVCLCIMEVLQKDFHNDKYCPCPLLREKVAAGHLGRKSGQGFYTYQH